MNKTYSLASSRFTDGEIRVGYNLENLLIKFEVIGEISAKRLGYMHQYLPLTFDALQELKAKAKTLTITEILEEITFELFWKKCNDASRSSKKKSLAKWNKLNVPNQRKAFYFWPVYLKNIPDGIAVKYVETYLHAEQWNN